MNISHFEYISHCELCKSEEHQKSTCSIVVVIHRDCADITDVLCMWHWIDTRLRRKTLGEIMPSETDVAPKSISVLDWDGCGNLWEGLC